MSVTMTREETVDRLRELAAEQVDADVARVTLDTHLFNDLGYDSLDQIEYAMTIEEEFDIDIPDESANDVKTVRDALEALLPLLS